MQVEPLQVPVAGPPGGEPLTLPARRFRFTDGGPNVLVTAGLHGNEVNGIGAVWHLQELLRGARLGGTVTVVACANPLATLGKCRRIPGEDTDLNRVFPGHQGGYLAERLAAGLARLLHGHDALIDVHTTGWCVPHVLLDRTPGEAMARHLECWAAAAEVPVVREMDDRLADLQGLGSCWSAHAVRQGKPALTVELPGFLTLIRAEMVRGAALLLALVRAARATASPPARRPRLLERTELHGTAAGLFEARREPGVAVQGRDVIGVIRGLAGEVREEVVAARAGTVLVLQTGSAVHPGAWLATLGSATG